MKPSESIATSWDVIVIGGGASGMMAAGRSAERGRKVLLLEKNKTLGSKLKITGGGRCNITNAEFDTRVLLANYGDAADYLFSPFSIFGVKETFEFFEARGLSLIVQDRKRAFPKTERALDVFRILEKYIHDGKVQIITGSGVDRVLFDKNKITGVIAKGTTYNAQNYILATGGTSHPETGSTGDAFAWLKKAGHTVVAPTPSIVPVSVKEPWLAHVGGKSVEDAKLTFYVEGKKQFVIRGRILFTHFGLSGPTILNSAAQIGDLLHEGTVTAHIDFVPSEDVGQFEKRVIAVFDANKNKSLKNIASQFIPAGFGSQLLALIPEIDPATKAHSITKEQRKQLTRFLKAVPITITQLMGVDRAVVADGGVILDEIDMKTMRSKLITNLFLTGDLLHVRRPTGGYSLQLCWTTGFVAGNSLT